MGALASLTHDLGVLLCFSSFFYWYKEIKILSGYQKILRFLSIGIIPSGLLLYMGYLWLIFGSPFEFMHAQLHWHRHIVIPIYNIIKSLVLLPYSDNNNHKFLVLVNCLSALLFLVLLIPLIKDKTIPLEQKIFYILTFFCSIISDTGNSAQSYARFMLILFPGFMLLGKLIENETAFISMLLLFFSFETILLGMFVTGYWVT
ncbi:MAG: hypothetical protein NTU49_02415, partial [Gammaproteobacteria bacterium]|nr:hypothetical protein [Gammaproteobacteria bacterium]